MIYGWRFYEGFVGSRNLRQVMEGKDNPQTVQLINRQASKTVGTIVARVGLVRVDALACDPRFAHVEVLSTTSCAVWLYPDVITCEQAREIIDNCS